EYVADPARKAALVAARLCDHGHVWRHGAVARARRLVVGKGRRESVGEPARAILDLALIVRLALDLVFGGDGGGVRGGATRRAGGGWGGGERGPAGICQRAERDQFQPVTNLADLAVDVEPALKLCAVEFPERSSERPFVRGRRRRLVLLRPRRHSECRKQDGE